MVLVLMVKQVAQVDLVAVQQVRGLRLMAMRVLHLLVVAVVDQDSMTPIKQDQLQRFLQLMREMVVQVL